MDREHESLLMRFFDGGMDDADACMLTELLKTDSDFQTTFLELSRQERVLRVLFEPTQADMLSRQVVNQIRAQESGEDFVKRVKKEITGRATRALHVIPIIPGIPKKKPSSRRSHRTSRSLRKLNLRRTQRPWPLGIGIAAMLLLGFGVVFLYQRKSDSSSSALIVTVDELNGNDASAEGAGGVRKLLPGGNVSSGETVRTGLYAKVRFHYQDGTWVELGASSELVISQGTENSAKQLRLNSGLLNADVRPQPDGAPFTVATPQARATVRGTVLAVTISEAETRLEVRRGKVVLQRLSDHTDILVTAGYFSVANRGMELALKSDPISPPDSMALQTQIGDGTPKDFLTRVHEVPGAPRLPYRLFVPFGYDKNRKYPLVLFLHGLGEKGADNIKTLNNDANGAMVFVKAAHQSRHPCFMLVPQSASGWWVNDMPALTQLLADLPKEFSLDADRFYVTGISFGGTGTWEIATRMPNLFAAAVPIAGGGDTSKARAIAGLPVWNFHTTDDTTMKVQGSRAMIDALRKAGGRPFYTEYPTGGHASAWERAYKDTNLIEWIMAQSRGHEMTPPAKVPFSR